ncbi:N-acetylmuramoyl-L-alanine amidase [Anabaena sp. FACHB-1250]|uniref:Cell wall hydrolase/autolysin n=2 Tax=Dolichospermum TaxID=748770 RepID=A0A480AI45_9CYAN|nr:MULTISPECIES: N-acetylmuramoyl-L-alanine amidase [Nostocales]MBD2143434.1 N-acetylmuramoyl-L-alanine amidase [Anabaena sp. FACHB-1250]MBD2270905.1 N-acetylmuramoyl-L-alanine amidase [Anabaena sp. FACHB-1391]MBE9220679.1 N-acetylmuramoyl-L-alanine amidase [Dolichospermum flos-aquae LEGE 04289]GCL44042.1 cell wall hydrolase/autolysin [Dolichospermum planctonicum]
MGRIFISAAHGGIESGKNDPGAIAGGTTEAKEMILLRDLVVTELRSRNLEVLAVPDDLSAAKTIVWINARANVKDVALEIQANAASSPSVRGASVFYIAKNQQRQQNAELLLKGLLVRVPQLPSRGVKPDTDSGLGKLQFCRQTTIPALLLQVGFLSSPEDRALLQSRRRDFAVGIAEGLAAWNQVNDPKQATPQTNYNNINININGQNYSEQGLLINGNSYIPIDLVDRLRVDVSKLSNLRRITYRQIVYIKAIELRESHVSVDWDGANCVVKLRSILPVCLGQIEQIISNGNTSEVQLQLFLKNNNESALIQFPDLPKLYREEANIEGVNYDIAFCQMCLETGFLRFGTDIKPQQNNFAGLGAVGGGSQGASFPSARIGVRAHIQHLKAYASLEPLVQEQVDPRFRFVTRGVAPSINQLSGRWSADLDYGTKITSIIRRLYESANIL